MGKRLLLIEDEATLARAMARLLRRRDYDVFLAGSCEEARAAPGTFSLGVFDLDLPDGDGIELAQHLLANGAVRRAVFFSGTSNRDRRERAANLGPFVEKALGFPQLAATIDLAFADRRAKVAGAEGADLHAPTAPPPSGIRGTRH